MPTCGKLIVAPKQPNECYGLAKTALKEILDSGTYELNPSFTTLWDADEVWGKEAIWQAVLNEGDQWGGWDGAKWSEAHGWVGFYFGAPANGAWGTYAVSWELYDAYENGDKRRDGSLVTATIPESKLKEIGKEEGDTLVIAGMGGPLMEKNPDRGRRNPKGLPGADPSAPVRHSSCKEISF